jgi:hypothetical protein
MATNNLSLLRKGRPFIMRGAYVPTFFVVMCEPLAPLRPPSPSHGTLSIARSEASFRK